MTTNYQNTVEGYEVYVADLITGKLRELKQTRLLTKYEANRLALQHVKMTGLRSVLVAKVVKYE